MIHLVATLNGAIFVSFGNLVVRFDGSHYQCGIIEGGTSTIFIDMNREKLRHQNIERQRRQRVRKRRALLKSGDK